MFLNLFQDTIRQYVPQDGGCRTSLATTSVHGQAQVTIRQYVHTLHNIFFMNSLCSLNYEVVY